MIKTPSVKHSPDFFSRYFIIYEIIKKTFAKKIISVLELGGSGSLLIDLFQENQLPYDFTVADIKPTENVPKNYKYLQGNAIELGLPDASYNVLLSTDVLEHIPDDKKEKFIRENIRMASDLVILAAPFESEETDYCEHLVNNYYKKMTGKSHFWLKEHFLRKKPDKKLVIKVIKEYKLSYLYFESNNLKNWIMTILPNLLFEFLPSRTKKIEDLNEFFNTNIFNMDDFTPPGYRGVFIIFKNNKLKKEFKDYFQPEPDLTKQFKFQEYLFSILGQEMQDKGKIQKDLEMKILNSMNQLDNFKTAVAADKGELDYIKNSKFFRLWPYYIWIRDIFRSLMNQLVNFKVLTDVNYRFDPYRKWLALNYPSKKILLQQYKNSKNFKINPKISLLIPTYNTPEKFLRECIESVINQSYQNFELCIADDASTDPKVRVIIEEYADKDKRIKYVFREQNGHISLASNSALELATGEYVGLLDHDDILWPNALYEVVKALNNHPKTELFYSDEDKLEENGTAHANPFFKPGWSPDYLRSINYITHFCVIKTQLVRKVNGFRVGFEGAQDWDLFLRITNLLKPEAIFHIQKILYSWRKSIFSTASEKNGLSVKNYAYRNQQKVLEKDLESKKQIGWVEATNGLGSWHVRYRINGNPKVSIIIPTKDKYPYILRCLDSIIKKTSYQNYELVIVDTGSEDKYIWQLYDQIKNKHMQTRVVKWNKEFNFSSVCNFGASKARGEYLIFLNNDTEILTSDWIEGLLEHGQRPEIGAVGCMLLYPDQSIQHLGGVLGISGSNDPTVTGVAGHAYRGILLKDFNYFDKEAIKNYSFVTAACLLISKKKFYQVGQFDPKFKIAFNDVDFGLRIHFKHGLYNLINPFVRLTHYESVSVAKPGEVGRNIEQMQKEVSLFIKRWGDTVKNDPFYNSNLTKTKEDFSINI